MASGTGVYNVYLTDYTSGSVMICLGVFLTKMKLIKISGAMVNWISCD